jgi:hypothetical protein
LKITFPSLKNLLYYNKIIKVVKAELILKPVNGSYNNVGLRLPSPLHLAETDGSNTPGGFITNSDGTIRASRIFTDYVYQKDTRYVFNITDYISGILQNQLPNDFGFYLAEYLPGNTSLPPAIDKAVIGDKNSQYKTRLLLSFITEKD